MGKFFFQCILFIAIVILCQVIIARYTAPRIPELALLDQYLSDKYQIIYVGDSAIRSTAKSDRDKSSIVEMLARIYPSGAIGDLSHGAYHLGIYEAFLKHIAKSPTKPRAVIVPINLRSFSPGWDMLPAYQFEREQFYFTAPSFATYFFKPLAILRAINLNKVTYAEYSRLPVYYGKEKVGIVSDFDNFQKYSATTTENIRNKFIFDYMYNLDKNHRKLKSLNAIVDIAARAGIKIYIYIHPVDFMAGEKYVGPDFTKQVAANTDTICFVLAGKGLPCINLALRLDSGYFNYESYPNEHLNEKGRKFIAEEVNRFFLK